MSSPGCFGFSGGVVPEAGARMKLVNVLRAEGRELVGETRWVVESVSADGLMTRKRHFVRREAVSLGLDTYLTAPVERFPEATVFDLIKNPLHRWKCEPSRRGGKRGVVCGFSPKARMRLMKKLAECRKDLPCHFVTLTVPWDLEPDLMKILLDNWIKRMKRKFGKDQISGVWKMEPHKRVGDAWHFHVIIFGCRFLPHKWLKSMWNQVIGAQSKAGAWHRGVDVKFIKAGDRTGVRNYIAKYMSKEIEGDCGWTGRMWGKFGDLPTGEKVAEGMTVRELVWVWRLISRKRKKNVVRMSGVFFCEEPEDWLAAARKICNQK